MNIQACSTKTALVLSLLATGIALSAAPASAATKNRSNYQNAGGNCHGSSPWDEAALQRGALGYRNTYSNNGNVNNNVLVTCNFATDVMAVGNPNSLYTIKVVQMYAHNTYSNMNVNMSCTITAGYSGSPSNFSNTKSIALPKSGALKPITWTAADNAGKYLPGPASVVCSLPAGVELNDAIIMFDVDVGN